MRLLDCILLLLLLLGWQQAAQLPITIAPQEQVVGKVLIKVSKEEALAAKSHFSEPFTLPSATETKFSAIRWKIHLPAETASLVAFNIRDGGLLYDTKCLSDVRDGQVTQVEFAKRFSTRLVNS